MESINALLIYLFGTPSPSFAYEIPVLVYAIVLIAGGLAIKIISKKIQYQMVKRALRGYPSKLWLMGIALALSVVFRKSQAPLLSSRILLFFFLVLSVLFVVNAWKTYQKELQNAHSHETHKERLLKYLPRKKK